MCTAGTQRVGSLPRSRIFLNKLDDPFQTGGVSASILSNSCENRSKSLISHSFLSPSVWCICWCYSNLRGFYTDKEKALWSSIKGYKWRENSPFSWGTCRLSYLNETRPTVSWVKSTGLGSTSENKCLQGQKYTLCVSMNTFQGPIKQKISRTHHKNTWLGNCVDNIDINPPPTHFKASVWNNNPADLMYGSTEQKSMALLQPHN